MQARDVWEFQRLEIHFPRASLQLGFSRVFNRSWATVFVPRVGNRSSGCWLAQFMCAVPPTKERRCDRQRNWSRHSTRLVPLHVFRARPDIKTLSANTSPLALTEQHNIFHKHVQTPRHSKTGQHNTLHKHVQTPRHTFPDATGNADIRAPMLHLSTCALYLKICASTLPPEI